MTPFPSTNVLYNPGKPLTTSFNVYCVCCLPNIGGKMVNCDQCREWYHFVCVELNTCLEDNIKTGTCMIVFQLQVANSRRVGTCGTCHVTIACICIYIVQRLVLCEFIYYPVHKLYECIHLLHLLISDALYNNGWIAPRHRSLAYINVTTTMIYSIIYGLATYQGTADIK